MKNLKPRMETEESVVRRIINYKSKILFEKLRGQIFFVLKNNFSKFRVYTSVHLHTFKLINTN